MKKTIALLLCLLMAVSLAACGGQKTTEESSTNTEQTETKPSAEENEQPEETGEPDADEPVETKPAFDTSWAGDEYVMPIPEPPFTRYDLNVNEHSGGAVYFINTNSDEVGALTEGDILGYRDALKAAGFTQVDNDSEFNTESYFFEAHTEDGTASVIFECHIQSGAIGIIVETTSAASTAAFDTSWASNDFEKLIPQPPFEGWSGEETSKNVYEMETSQANADGSGTYYDTWAEYIQTLSDCGFTVQGDAYSAEGTDGNGNMVKLQCGDGYAWITIIKAAATQNDSESISSSDNSEEGNKMPELPDLEWTCEEKENSKGTKYLVYEAENVPQNVVEDYVEQLKSAGYSMDEESFEEDGEWYFWGFYDDVTGGSVNIEFSSKYGTCYIFVF